MTDTVRVFRLSVVRFWLWAALVDLAFNLVVYALIRYSGMELNVVALATCSLGISIVAVVYGLTYRVEVSEDGLGFTDPEGHWEFLDWDQIAWAERTWVFGLPTLELKAVGSERSKGLLLLLGSRKMFEAAVAEAAGPSHPVTWALMESV